MYYVAIFYFFVVQETRGEFFMYSVFIVDDDAVILDEIINSVPWMDNGFEVIGYSTSATDSIQTIISLMPDVVFTDLRMPEMDGIDMIKELSSLSVSCEFVMLSAYGTFGNSRRFFKEKGFDFLLKPIDQKEVQFLLESLAEKLSSKKPAEPILDTTNTNTSFLMLVEYLNEHFQEKHTLESLSNQFNLGPNYICNLFTVLLQLNI